MKKIFLILVGICFYSTVFCQWRKVEKIERDKALNIKIAFLSRVSLKSPGFNLGAEYMVQRKSITIKNFKRTKERYITLNFSLFDEPDLNNNIALTTEWLSRSRFGNSGFFTESSFGFGIGRGINYIAPPTYVKNVDGTESIKSPNINTIMIPIAMGVGYDFKPKKNLPIKVYAKGSFNPIYSGFLFNLFVKPEIGFVTSLSIFKKK